MSIPDNLAFVRDRIAAAAVRAGRSPSDIALMAVSKTFSASCILQAYNAGQRLFGENRVREFAEKHPDVQSLPGIDFHLIGHLQSNKSAKAAELFHAIDSVDSLRLAERLNQAAAKLGKTLPVLLEINVGGEQQKAGLAPDSAELEHILALAPHLTNVTIRGLMTIPPFTENPQHARPYFAKLRQLREKLTGHKLPSISFDVLSMGMSHDFEIAIEEGSTCVRVGTAIFGNREKH